MGRRARIGAGTGTRPGPSTIRTGEQPDTGSLLTAPGETFSNFSHTLKEGSGALVTMPPTQANDALGHRPQDFEMSPVGQQGPGFVAGGYAVVNYEDSYAIDRCSGDAALEHSLDLLDELR